MDVLHKIPGLLLRHPALLAAQKERAENAQLGLADRITRGGPQEAEPPR